jgi:hypothetical protein
LEARVKVEDDPTEGEIVPPDAAGKVIVPDVNEAREPAIPKGALVRNLRDVGFCTKLESTLSTRSGVELAESRNMGCNRASTALNTASVVMLGEAVSSARLSRAINCLLSILVATYHSP